MYSILLPNVFYSVLYHCTLLVYCIVYNYLKCAIPDSAAAVWEGLTRIEISPAQGFSWTLN